MFHIDDGFLSDVGLAALPPEVKERYRDAIRDRMLDEAIDGVRGRLEPGALEAFDAWLVDREPEPALAGAWLLMRRPTLRPVFEEARLSVGLEIGASAHQLLALERLAALEPEPNRTSVTRM